jgi:hypothetical protein
MANAFPNDYNLTIIIKIRRESKSGIESTAELKNSSGFPGAV